MTRKRAIIVLGEKGGSGKTVCARLLVHIYRSCLLKVASLDGDGRVGQLLQHFGKREPEGKLCEEQDPLTHVGYFDVRDPGERDTLLEALQTGADVLLIDMPGGSIGEIGKVTGDAQALFRTYAAHGYEVIIVIVITVIKASMRTVAEAIEEFGDSVRYVVVKNLGCGGSPSPDDFGFFDGEEEDGVRKFGNYRRMLEEHGGEIIVLPELQAQTLGWLDRHDYTFAEGMRAGKIAHQTRIEHWIEKFTAQLALSRLAPAPSPQSNDVTPTGASQP